jgi:hypothetical protein
MNAFRKIRMFVLLGFVAVLALGLSTAPAEAGHHHFHKFHHFGHKHFHHGHYWPTYYQPIVKYIVKPVSYPVTYYDCYGQPYVVWQTSYQTVPSTY